MLFLPSPSLLSLLKPEMSSFIISIIVTFIFYVMIGLGKEILSNFLLTQAPNSLLSRLETVIQTLVIGDDSYE